MTPIYTKNNHIKKVYLQISKKPGSIFCLYPFLNIKESIIQILKKLDAIFCLYPFSNVTYLKNTIFYTNNFHRNHHNYCMYTLIILKFFLFFIKNYNFIKKIFSPHKHKKIFFLLNIRMVNQGLNLSLNELKLIAEYRNIIDYEYKSAKDLIKALRGSRPRLGIKKK